MQFLLSRFFRLSRQYSSTQFFILLPPKYYLFSSLVMHLAWMRGIATRRPSSSFYDYRIRCWNIGVEERIFCYYALLPWLIIVEIDPRGTIHSLLVNVAMAGVWLSSLL